MIADTEYFFHTGYFIFFVKGEGFMNKIYKLVWSKVRNTWVVVSEIAKGHGKSSSSEGSGKRLKSLVVMALLGCFVTAGGTVAIANGKESTVYGGGVASGLQSVAIGAKSKAEKQFSTAVGYQADAKEDDSTAYGYKAIATGLSSTALGNGAEAKEKWSTAVGSLAHAYEVYSTAVGQGAQATGQDSTAVGSVAEATGSNSTALGQGANAQGASSMALGKGAKSTVDGSVALGEGTVAGRAAGTVGYVASAGDTTFDAVLTALDKKADYDKWKATNKSLIEKYNELTKAYLKADERDKAAKKKALDDLNEWKQKNGNFIDELTKKEKLEATWKASRGAVSVGGESEDEAGNKIIATRQITNVAAGSEDTDAVNVAQLKALNDKVDKGSVHYFSVNSTDKGADSNWKNDGATGDGAVAIGVRAQAKEDYSTALGNDAKALKYGSMALGYNAQAQGGASIALGYEAYAKETASTALGDNAKALGDYSTAVGTGAQAPVDGSVALGEGTVAGREAGTVGYLASAGVTTFDDVLTALGKKTEYAKWEATIDASIAEYNMLAEEYFHAVGDSDKAAAKDELDKWKRQHPEFVNALEEKSKLEATWKATKAAVSVGRDSTNENGDRISRQITNVAAGTQDTDAVNVAQLKALNTKVDKGAVHYFSVNSTDKGAGSNWKNDGATGKDAVAIGYNAQAQGASSVALGHGAQAQGPVSTALGHGAQAQGYVSTALGYNAQATGGSSVALGHGAQAQGASSVALGYGAQAPVDGSVALGKGTVAVRKEGTVGYLESAGGTTFDDVLNALGKKTEYNNWKNKIDESKAEYNRLTNAYFNASESGKAAAKTALETWKVNHKEFLDALEKKSKLEATWKATKAAVSVGRDSTNENGDRISRQITNVAAGTQDTDAVNVAQLKALDNKVTDKLKTAGGVHYFSVKSGKPENPDGTNWNNDGAAGDDAVAIGNGAQAQGASSTALGAVAQAQGEYSMALGAVAIAQGNYSMALGRKANAQGNLSMALGDGAIAAKDYSTALGNGAQAQENSSMALGYGAIARVEGSVALGIGSIASIDKGVFGYDPFTGKASTENSAIWKATHAAFSVGSTEDEHKLITRQITGVAAGSEDTDVVNVAQLKVLNTKVDKVAANSTAYTVETKENNDNTTTVTIKSNKAGDKGTTVTVATKDIHITSGTYDKNTKKLTFTTNTNTTFDVDMNDVIHAAAEGSVHYLSVNSSEQGAGSNYKNDGAVGENSIAIGVYAKADSVGGVALGRNSTAKRAGGLFGYNPKNGAAFVDGKAVAEYLGKTTEYDALQTEMTAKKTAVEEAKAALKDNPTDTTKKENLNKAYQALEEVQQKENLLLGAYRSASGYGAFSVGNEEKGITRQITGVAAGTKDTDAVNVAQLKVLNTKVDKVAANSTAYTVETKENNDNTTTVTIKSNKAGDKGTTVTVATKDIHITSGTYDKNTKKLTFTTNTNTTFDVDMNDVIHAAAEGSVHYLSVNSSETGEGSNYKNDGAVGKNSMAIGAYAMADSVGGVALGRDSTAKREGGLFGYNPKNGAAFVDGTAVAEYLGKTTEYDALQTEMTAKKTAVEEAKAALKDNPTDTTKKENLNKAYQALEEVQQKENLLLGAYRSASGYGAFSVGNEEKGITRQITGVAAGTKDTDAVNVAQLKVLNTKVDKVAANSTAYTVETKENNDNTTTVTIKSNKAGDKGTTVTVATKDIHITSGTYDKNTKKLTFTTNTNTTFDVDMNDVINAAAEGSVHYLSVKSSETGEGSNYKNDGAKAKGSIVLGVRSSSEGINGVVVGNDNKLTGIKNNQNNSVVIGTGLNVDGVHNIVVGTNYENYDQKETKVKGEHNTVIGNGNLVGYTAVKDPNDDRKWIYTAGDGSDQNVVVGMCNTANGGSIAVGSDLEVEDRGRAFGSGNKIIGSDNRGGQWGLALGSNNTVKGEKAVSVGTGTNAFGDWTVAIGSEAKTHATNSIAMGYQAETVNGWSAAIGSEAKTTGTASTAVGGLSASATVDYGAAFGSFSVAQRASGVAGYLANGQTGSAWKSNLGAFSVGNDVKGFSRQITGVAAGSEDTDAVNVAQLKALEKKLIKVLPEVVGDQKTGVVVEKNPKENTSTPSTGGTTPAPAAENKTVYKVKLDKKIDVGHISIDGTENKEKASIGDVQINGEKGKGTVTGLSNKTWDEKHVVSGRAATEDQLQAVSQKNRQAISELGTRMERGTASAAALAALHPQEFDPADKWDFAVGYSNYRSANTFAFGGFYRPNERTLVSLGGTFGGENIVNVGLSFKTGKGSDGISTSRIAMAREIQALKLQNKQQEEKSQQLKQDNQAIRKENQEMKKEVEWLKRQVAKLLTK